MRSTPPNPIATPAFRLANIVALAWRVSLRLERLARLADDDPAAAHAFDRLQAELAGHVAHLGALCEGQGATPAVLPERSRRVHAWLAFLADPARLAAHVEGVRRGNAALREALPGRGVRVELVGSASLWRWRHEGDGEVLAVNEGFTVADEATWRRLVAAATRPRELASRAAVRTFTDGAAYREVVATLDALAEPAAQATRGAVHDLDARFEAVNARYFDGQLPRPTLTWGRAPTVHRFGSYEPVRDRVVISRSLDHPDVPERVVDYLLFHELLHKHVGTENRGLRRGVHTPAFHAAEARFEGLAEMERFLSDLGAKVRRAKRRNGR